MSHEITTDTSSPSHGRFTASTLEQTRKQFEELVANPTLHVYVFRLYVSGTTMRSTAAITNVRALCEKYLPKRYELLVIDVYQQSAATRAARVIATPTLVKELPAPVKRFVGDMSNLTHLLKHLQL